MNRRDHERIDRALEGALSEADLATFRADLVRDAALRSAYVERAFLDGALRAERDRLPSLLAADSAAAAPRAASTPRWFATAATILSVAAAVFVVGLYFRSPPSPAPAPLAMLTHATNTRWAGSTLPTAEGSRLGTGTLALVEGIATLTFTNGARLTLEASTTLELVSPLHTRLLEGSITADIPNAAHGFTVETPDLRVVDLGTRFGVTTSSTGNSQAFVFEGEVRVDDPSGRELKRVTSGKSFHRSSGAVASANLEPSHPRAVDRIDGWTAIPTSVGRGKDAFARRGTAITEPQPLLMVKHSDLPLSFKNERVAVFTFDLEDVRLAGISEAELLLDPEPSGYGFSTMVPDSRFAVYGVLDESADTWNEFGLTWENVPPTDASAVAAGRAQKLAEFSVPRGASGEPIVIRAPEIAGFLHRDTNRLVTFVLVRETGETDPTGLVHAFASKEHPTARPPTLRLR